jgi:hypothetical protein
MSTWEFPICGPDDGPGWVWPGRMPPEPVPPGVPCVGGVGLTCARLTCATDEVADSAGTITARATTVLTMHFMDGIPR